MPSTGDDWIGIGPEPLPVPEALSWAVRPDCGAVVTFCGTVRDHSAGLPGVIGLRYDAYDAYALPRLAGVATTTRERWPQVKRLALLHRTGALGVGETAVVVVASSPHREQAFGAASLAIDLLKQQVPIWKLEYFENGHRWVSGCEAADHDGGSAP